MGLVEWTRLSGEQVEELVAVLLCRKIPKMVRIRPSAGDKGIDLLVQKQNNTLEVYQVKKFATNLTASQRKQIQNSLSRFEQYRIERSVTISEWHLVLPLDPTHENLEWLSELTADLPYTCDWRGLSFIDGLAAEFPDVIDYYIRDGRQRLEDVIGKLTSIAGMGLNNEHSFASLTQLGNYLQKIYPLLDTDPHFTYKVSIGPSTEDVEWAPGAILTMTQSDKSPENHTLTIHVFPRFAAALDFRPIPIDITIHAKKDLELQHKLTDFFKYGTPVSAPIGTADLKMDLPFGLGGDIFGAGLTLAPTLDRSTPKQVLRMVTLDPNDNIISSILIDMDTPTFGITGTGARRIGTEQNGVFTIELLMDMPSNEMTIKVQKINIEGRAPHDVIDGLSFLCSMYTPNRIAIAAPRGPITNVTSFSGAPSALELDQLLLLKDAATSLIAIQDNTTTQLMVPDIITKEDLANWRAAKRLLAGEQLTGELTGGTVHLHPDVPTPNGKFAIAFYSDLSVTVGSTVVSLGKTLDHCPKVEVDPHSIHPHEDHIDCKIRSVDGALATRQLLKSTVIS